MCKPFRLYARESRLVIHECESSSGLVKGPLLRPSQDSLLDFLTTGESGEFLRFTEERAERRKIHFALSKLGKM